jgi:hypothetical protein
MKSPLKVLVSVTALLAMGAFAACGSSGNGAANKDGGAPKNEEAGAPDGSSEAAGPPQSIFVVPSQITDLSGVTFFTHPWPSDLRRDANGFIIVQGLNNAYNSPIVNDYITAITGVLDGFSVAAPGYFLFNQGIDPTTLPASPPDTLSPTATVQLINVDPSSPEHDQRSLAQTYWRQTATDYWQADTLVIGPALGYTLLPSTKYAIVVTNGVKTPGGAPFAPSSDLRQVLGLDPPTPRTQAAHDLFAPALADVVALGIPTSSIVHFTTFTTNDPAAELFSIVDDVKGGSVPAPTILPAELEDGGFATDAGAGSSLVSSPGDGDPGVYDVYYAWYGPSPNYQAGTAPYTNGGGNFVFQNGHAVVQNTFPMRMTIVIPNATACPMPANGYPVVLYGPGSGCDYQCVIEEGPVSVGQVMAQQCLASIGTDNIFSGARPGGPLPSDPDPAETEEVNFFNFDNPSALRTNSRQAAIDVTQEARLFTDTKITIPASVSVTGSAITFDPTKILYMGHSQGSLSGPPWLAADGVALGAVLSGASASVPITLLDKTSPAPSVAALWLVLLGLANNPSEVNIFHPMMSFAQTVVDPFDPLVYLRYLTRAPRPGHAPKSIYQTEGVYPDGGGDTYAPPHGIEVASTQIGLPLQSPVIRSRVEAPWGGLVDGLTIQDGGLSGNLADGSASGVLGQFEPLAGDDGHFVFFDIPACHDQAAGFAKSLVTNPVGNVPPVGP